MTDKLQSIVNREEQLVNTDNRAEFSLGKFTPIELAWDKLIINATIKVGKNTTEKCLLNNLKGVMKPAHFTAILGPSGSGKTTLLNFLSGRLISDNLKISGELSLNGKRIDDIDKFNDQMAYVMQDDILLATFSPREAFYFSANMRLTISPEEKAQRVESLIRELGITKCADTRVGNTQIRGVSGGERKRASIGVELLTNPSLIFLDEPTTGLDSSTALQVIDLLKRLAKNGRTIVSTIHQPSSEIFNNFDRLMLLVRGNIIYQGDAEQAINYFANMGYSCPNFSNPSDYFMKLMNEEGLLVEKIQAGESEDFDEAQIKQEFEQRLEGFINNYKNSNMIKDLETNETALIKENDLGFHIGFIQQFVLIYQRSFLNEIRNPMDVKLKIFQSIVNAIMLMLVYSDLGKYNEGLQNRFGALFFICTANAFGGIQGALHTFSMERPLFLRERINKTYSVHSFFWARSLAEFPFQIIYPSLCVIIVYYVIGLSDENVGKFFMLIFVQFLTYQYAVSYGLLLSTVIPKIEVATALVPALVIPFMILGGFFVNQDNIPYIFYPFTYLSMFKYGFEAAVINEFDDVDYECMPDQLCNPVKMLSINLTKWECCYILIGLAVGIRMLAYLALHLISSPEKPKLQSPENMQINNKSK
ncbi:unnamed protein product [Paramecium sonneborni]|uniref:ABC transporter domain-containing protein n=1 Tax=Paramecium sonneborni TaxID=65129 RepID=A0A8S1KFC0_9CILI|nr:unnamed protein product [Paramecium sonneborni]